MNKESQQRFISLRRVVNPRLDPHSKYSHDENQVKVAIATDHFLFVVQRFMIAWF
jgi:hypothetical protein